MTRLIIEEDMGSENGQDFAFFDAAQKKRIVGHDAPALEGV